MELKEGMYVRTKRNGIGKVKGFASSLTDDYIENEKGSMIPKDEIIKPSYKPIELIEVGDYVNGFPVIHKENNILKCGLLVQFKENEIKTIATKEQFEQIQYRIGEE